MNSSISKTSIAYKIGELLISGQYQTYTESEKSLGDGQDYGDANSQTHEFGARLGGVSLWLFNAIIRAKARFMIAIFLGEGSLHER
jgi:hypothetical protein